VAETYTIESVDGDVPVDPALLRELADLLREDEDLGVGGGLTDRPPAPGQQGAVPVALEIVSAATPLGTAFAGLLIAWVNSHKVRIKVRHGDDCVEISAPGNVRDAQRLIEQLNGDADAA
jgi:hypothetical protein